MNITSAAAYNNQCTPQMASEQIEPIDLTEEYNISANNDAFLSPFSGATGRDRNHSLSSDSAIASNKSDSSIRSESPPETPKAKYASPSKRNEHGKE